MFRSIAILIFLASGCASGNAATLVFDSFTEGPFELSEDGIVGAADFFSGPVGEARSAQITQRLAADGTTLTSTLDVTSETLSLFTDGTSIDERPLGLQLVYFEGGPYSILGFDHFELDFAAVAGDGIFRIELGSAINPGPELHRIPIVPGTTAVPFDLLNFGAGGSVESFHAIRFIFEAESEQFSFTLDEIRLVPEPAAGLLAGLGALALALRRQRPRGPSD